MSYTFETEVDGIPCQCQVTYYYPGSPMIITGSGFGDAIEPEPEEFEFVLLDEYGVRDESLDAHVTGVDVIRLTQEYLASVSRNSDAD